MLLDVPLGRFGFTKTASLLKVYFLCRGLLTVVNLALAVLSFGSQLHSFWRCKYNIVWTPKFRFKILKGNVAKELNRSIYILCNMKDCEVLELNVQPDHVHLVAIIPPKVSISTLMGVLKGRSAIRLFNKTLIQSPVARRQRSVQQKVGLGLRHFCHNPSCLGYRSEFFHRLPSVAHPLANL